MVQKRKNPCYRAVKAVPVPCRCVCARLSPNLIAPDHLQGLLEVAAEEAGDKEDSTYLTAVLDLLVGCAASAPALFANLGTQVRPLVEAPKLS